MREKGFAPIIVLAGTLVIIFSLVFILNSETRNSLKTTTSFLNPNTKTESNLTLTPAITDKNIPSPTTCDTTSIWRPEINYYLIEVPCDWDVYQSDSGLGSADKFTAAGSDYPNLSISWYVDGSERDYPEGEIINIGGKQATKLIEDKYIHIHIKNVKGYDSRGHFTTTLNIRYLINDNEILKIEQMLKTIKFDLTEANLPGTRLIR